MGSFFSNVQGNIIDKTWREAGMLFTANFDCHKVDPLIYFNLRWQAYLPTLLYRADIFSLTSSVLVKQPQCQL